MAKSLEEMTIEELEIDMRNAINNRDSLRYKQVCDTLGMIPDVLDLYEKGEAEENYLITLTLEQEGRDETEKKGKTRTARKNPISGVRYSAFYNEWQRLHINERDAEADCDSKRKCLLIFPKFHDRGKQPIKNYSCDKIGHLYADLLEQAKKSLRQ